jgi:ribosomal protein L9
MANVHFQSFGYLFANGSQIDKEKLEVGQDKIMYLGVDGQLSIVSPPNSIPALTEAIKDSYKILTQNYGLPTSFAEGTTAESGVALRLRNQELNDSRKSDIVRWKEIEYKLFDVEKTIILHEEGTDAGELLSVDFSESTDVMSAQEQRDKWEWELAHGLIDKADILMQMNPDGFESREEAFDYLFERGEKEEEVVEETNPLQDLLTKPV